MQEIYPRNVEIMMSTLSKGKFISATEPWMMVILSANRLSRTMRRVNCTILDLSMAYTCLAPAIAANIDSKPRPHRTSSTICRNNTIKSQLVDKYSKCVSLTLSLNRCELEQMTDCQDATYSRSFSTCSCS